MNLDELLNAFIKFLPTLLVAVIAPAATLFVAKINRGSKREIDLINELQEENKINKTEIKDLQKQMRAARDYIEELRKWISSGQPPPPPKYPDSL